jgi:hypothetical protein
MASTDIAVCPAGHDPAARERQRPVVKHLQSAITGEWISRRMRDLCPDDRGHW